MLEGVRVIVADDHADIRGLVSAALGRAGALVEEAVDGRALLARVRPGSHALLLIDLHMPGLDGLEAARTLRARGHTEPLVALTAHAMAEHRDACLAAGFDEHLAKPFEARALVRRLAALLRRGRARTC